MATKTRNRSKGNLFSSEHKPMVEAAQKELREDSFAERLDRLATNFVAQASKRSIGWFTPHELTEEGIRCDGLSLGRLMDRMKNLIKSKAYGLGDYVYKVEWESECDDDGNIVASDWEIVLYRLGKK